jgi:hypothetical protein
MCLQKRLKYPFLEHRTNSIDVPGKNLHRKSHLMRTLMDADIMPSGLLNL